MAENPIRRIAKELDDAIVRQMNRLNNSGLDVNYTTTGKILAERIEGINKIEVTKSKKRWRLKF